MKIGRLVAIIYVSVSVELFAAEPHFSVTELGTLRGGSNSAAFAINNLGQIIGVSDTGIGAYHAVLFRDREIIDLGAEYDDGLYGGYDINDHGQYIAGVPSAHFDRKSVQLPT